MNPATQLLDATLVIGGAPILWREIIGNVYENQEILKEKEWIRQSMDMHSMSLEKWPN